MSSVAVEFQPSRRWSPSYIYAATHGASVGRRGVASIAHGDLEAHGYATHILFAVVSDMAEYEATGRSRTDPEMKRLSLAGERARNPKRKTDLNQAWERRFCEVQADALEEWGFPEYAAVWRASYTFARHLMDEGLSEFRKDVE